MSDVMTAETDVKARNSKQKYRVLRKQEDGLWKDLGLKEAKGPEQARKMVVEEYDLYAEVREGKVTLVAIGNRLWSESTPKAEPQPDRLIW